MGRYYGSFLLDCNESIFAMRKLCGFLLAGEDLFHKINFFPLIHKKLMTMNHNFN